MIFAYLLRGICVGGFNKARACLTWKPLDERGDFGTGATRSAKGFNSDYMRNDHGHTDSNRLLVSRTMGYNMLSYLSDHT